MGIDEMFDLHEKIMSHINEQIEEAIHETDWDETPVLIVALSYDYSLYFPRILIDRRQHVPADYQYPPDSEAFTITRPLLERLNDEYEGIPL